MQRKQKLHHMEQRSPHHFVVHSKLGEMVDRFCLLLFFILVDSGTFLALNYISPTQHDNMSRRTHKGPVSFNFYSKIPWHLVGV